MVKKTNGTTSPMNTGALKRVFSVLVVLLVASVLMVGAGSANTADESTEASATGLNYTQFLDALQTANYNYDGQGITVTIEEKELNTFFVHGSDTYQTTISHSGDITIKNVNFYATYPEGDTKKGVEMVFQNAGKLTLENCTFTGKVGVSTQGASTDITVNYCTFNGTTDRYSLHYIISPNVTVTNSKFTNIRGGMYLEGTKNIVTVTNNTFETLIADKGAVQFGGSSDYSTTTITLEQNTVDDSGAFIRQLNEGLVGKLDEDAIKNANTLGGNVYTSDSKIPVAAIDGNTYGTLVEAFAAVTSNEETTINLLRDAEGAGIFVAAGDKNIILDLNNHKYTCTGPAVGSGETYKTQAFHLEKGNTITIKNGEITSTANSGVKMLIQNYCDLILDTVKVNGTNVDGTYAISNNCGESVYKGTTEIIAPTGGVAFDVYYWPNGGYGGGVSVTIADSTVTITTGKVEFKCDGTDTDNHFAKAELLIPVGYEDKFTLDVCDHNKSMWGASNVAGMTKLVEDKVVTPGNPADAGVTTDATGKTTITGNPEIEGDNTAVVELTGGVTLKVTFDETISTDSVTGNVTEVEASYEPVDDVAVPEISEIATPATVSIALNIALGNVTELPDVSTTFNTTIAADVSTAHPGYFPVAMLTGESITSVNDNITEIEIIFTVPKAWVDAMGGKDSGRIFFFHITSAGVGTPQKVAGANIIEDGTNYKIKVYGNTFSTYALAGIPAPVTPPKDTGSSSSSSGSSVWLQEPVTPTEQPTQTPTETEQPTDTVPTDIPVTQPTATPSTPGFGILAALAGLGAVAVLRRK